MNGPLKLIRYNDFETRLICAKESNNLESFIDELNGLLNKNLNIYLANLFLARTFVAINDLRNARKFYDSAIKLAKDPKWLIDEIDEFYRISRLSLSEAGQMFNKAKVLGNDDQKLSLFREIYDYSDLRSEIFIHHYVTLLQRMKMYNEAHHLLDDNLKSNLPLENKAKFLILKAQMNSATDDYQEAIKNYSELIEINKKLNAKTSNLGHLYFEVAKLYLRLNEIESATSTAQIAYKYTPTAIISNFLNSIKRDAKADLESDFSIEINDDQIDYVSPMLKFDIEDFDYRDNIIVKNGKVSIEDADRLYSIAQNNITKDLSLVYPLYLEAAKAFNDLKAATYNYSDFIDALAKYSAHKSNAIFYTYRIELFNSEPDPNKLKRLKDSTCSYIEASLNLENDLRKLLFLLTNYLKVTVSYILYRNGDDFKDILSLKYFNQVIRYCVYHTNKDIVLKTHQAIIHFGSVSIRIWDRISRPGRDTGEFYNYLKSLRQQVVKKQLVEQLNLYENIRVDANLSVGQVFYRYIKRRKNQKELFEKNLVSLRSLAFIPKNTPIILETWNSIKNESELLSETDHEISNSLDDILKIYLPYLDRTISERTNILYQVRTEIDNQIKFILENTTYWGRAMFYPLLKKWRTDINLIERERVRQTIPILSALTDPSFIFKKNGSFFVNLVVKNQGQSTASSFILKLQVSALDGQSILHSEKKFETEIAVNGLVPIEIELDSHLLKIQKAAKLNVQLSPIYQNKEIIQHAIEFTLEKETGSLLRLDELPWNETKIPKQHLFKGRETLIKLLSQHYKSINRDKTYILYGLTRTGKSSVLRYLEKEIEGELIKTEGEEKHIITFFWDLSEASGQSNAQDLWAFLLYDSTISKIENLCANGFLPQEALLALNLKPRFKDWKKIIEHLNNKGYYPVFLIDEFAYYKLLHDNGRLDQSFLAAIRQYALNGISSFIFAGTYDLKELIKNSQYGITGQLTNTVEKLISNIDVVAAKDLINVIKDKLEFTPEAIEHILFLSGRVPYFIQILCKNCGYYAVENNRSILGYPEIEIVVKTLIGENRPPSEDSQITLLSAGTFQNNQYSPSDTHEIQSLISSICFKNKNKIVPRGISYPELQELWSSRDIVGFAPKLAEAIAYLRDKEIIEEVEDETITTYIIKVDLFRRWWENQHRDIELELDILKDK
jgi:hypothetical protein